MAGLEQHDSFIENVWESLKNLDKSLSLPLNLPELSYFLLMKTS